MFNKLRLKLTITNVVVVSIIFLIFIVATFLIMEKSINDQTDQLISLLSSDTEAYEMPEHHGNRDNREPQYRYFYVKVNHLGAITSTSPNLNLDKTILEIVSKAYNSSSKESKIELNKQHYRFVKIPQKDNTGISIIFVNTFPEHEMLDDLLKVLALSGALGLSLAFFGSLFMANKALIPIAKSWKRQKDFVADASHELRTPLSVIETTLDLVMNRKDQTIESQMKWLQNIQTENKIMTKLVSELLFLARADSDQVQMEMKVFPLHTTLVEAYIPFEAIALQAGIQLDSFTGPEIDFYGDEGKIKQLVAIFIDNAIKHTPPVGQIRMKLCDLGGSVQIIVSDTGEGIGEEDINKIFDRFYRVDKARSRKEGSLGLGLSIAEWIVKQHHGTIKVDSVKGQGTTFYISFPKVYK